MKIRSMKSEGSILFREETLVIATFNAMGPSSLKTPLEEAQRAFRQKFLSAHLPMRLSGKLFFYFTAYKNKWAVKIAIYILT